MRTLEELNKILSDVEKPEEAFRFCNGMLARNIYELITGIEALTDAQFANHVNKEKNDFAKWVMDVLKYAELADALSKSKNKQEHLDILRKAVNELEDAVFQHVK